MMAPRSTLDRCSIISFFAFVAQASHLIHGQENLSGVLNGTQQFGTLSMDADHLEGAYCASPIQSSLEDAHHLDSPSAF